MQSMSSYSPEKRNKLDTQGNLVDGGILLKHISSQNEDASSAMPEEGIPGENLPPIKNGSTNVPKDSTGGSEELKGYNGRKDRFGTKISRGKKKHRVTFKDQIGKGKVAKVYFVESFKKYNVETTNSTCT